MSSSSSPALSLEVPQTWLRLVPTGLLLIMGVAMSWLTGLNAWPARLVLMLAAISLSGLSLWLEYASPAQRIVGVSWLQNREWRLRPAQGAAIPVRLSSRSWLCPWLMCLKFDSPAGRYAVMVWCSELSPAAWHQWRLRLRLEGRSAAAPEVVSH